jgi:hypothetical protein
MIPWSTVCVLFAFGACARPYAYTFLVTEPAARDAPGGAQIIADADVEAQILVDANADAVHLEVTNKTEQVLQIEWAAIAIHGPDGRTTTLRPDVDLGWVEPEGGSGGSGGSGRSQSTHTDENGNTVVDDPGCSPGSSGSSGSSGHDGSPGASGSPGKITVTFTHTPS